MVSPECDEKIPEEDELHFSSGLIRLEVVSDLAWTIGKLIKAGQSISAGGLWIGRRGTRRLWTIGPARMGDGQP